MCFKDLLPSTHGLKGLSLHEVNEIIRRTGKRLGYEVISEYPCKIDQQHVRKIDWVWRNGLGDVAAAFEVEGCNAPPSSILGDRRKFDTLSKRTKLFIVTYSTRFSTTHNWKSLPEKTAAIQGMLKNSRIQHIADTELISTLGSLPPVTHRSSE